MEHWAADSVFYHIYPLGLCGAPKFNSQSEAPFNRLKDLWEWGPYLREMGVNAVCLGPVFESESHGYDTADYSKVDRRLGKNEDLKKLVECFHENRIRVVLDGVFNHSGRRFFAFEDLQRRGAASPYCSWYSNVRFSGKSPLGDDFTYEGWSGHYNLVKFNLKNPEVASFHFRTVSAWIEAFDIDGLRLDAADVMDFEFMKNLSEHCHALKPDFWIFGEVVHGDYSRWILHSRLDSVTNYEMYKSLYSSFNDRNFFELAYSLNREFGNQGIYRNFPLFNFVDNHDVSRITETLKDKVHLFPLYGLLFTIPGIPSIYYGSEWGIAGRKNKGDDAALRPSLKIQALKESSLFPNLKNEIERFIRIRQNSKALKMGDYRSLHIDHLQFAFERKYREETFVVAVNAAQEAKTLCLDLNYPVFNAFDILNNEEVKTEGTCLHSSLYPHWLKIIRVNAK